MSEAALGTAGTPVPLQLTELTDGGKPPPESGTVGTTRTGHAFPTVEEINALADQARQEAFAQGLEAGNKRGYEQGMAAAAEQVRQLGELFDSLARLDQEVVAALSRLAQIIARALVVAQLQIAPETVASIVAQALQLLPQALPDPQGGNLPPGGAPVTVVVNPEDQALLARYDLGAQVVADASIERGGCQVRQGFSSVDATLQQRINQVALELATATGEAP